MRNVTVGNYIGIAPNVIIGVGSYPTNLLSTQSIFYNKSVWNTRSSWARNIEYEEYKPIKIGNDVWIGIHAIIMDGVSIGDGAIVAAGAIVTKDVLPYAIVGGVPAKVIKYRFSPEMIARLEEIQWWNLPDDEITRVIDLFHTKNPTMEDLDKYFPKKHANTQ